MNTTTKSVSAVTKKSDPTKSATAVTKKTDGPVWPSRPAKKPTPVVALPQKTADTNISRAEPVKKVEQKVQSAKPIIPAVKKVDRDLLVKQLTADIMNNKYFALPENEARTIAVQMVDVSADQLMRHERLFTQAERKQLCDELKNKYDLS